MMTEKKLIGSIGRNYYKCKCCAAESVIATRIVQVRSCDVRLKCVMNAMKSVVLWHRELTAVAP